MLEAVQSELQHDDQASAVLEDFLQTEREISAELKGALPTAVVSKRPLRFLTNVHTSRFGVSIEM